MRIVTTVLAALIVLGLAGCGAVREWPRDDANAAANAANAAARRAPEPVSSVHLAFGNPSKATADAADRDNFLIVGEGSAISYNNSRGTANWVAWRTTREDLGSKLQRPDFRPDPRSPAGFARIAYFDYSGSGYNRGHLLPSADRFGDATRNEETFFMTNIVPQTGSLNQYPWETLESYSRRLVRNGNDVYTIAGVYGDKGRIKNKITVPTNCWKVVIVLPRGRGAADVNERTRVIAVDMPNTDGLDNQRWERYRTTVREIERRTGYDLLDALPKALQDTLETRIDGQ